MSHQASEQMLGYIYQIYYALRFLILCEHDTDQICIEKFDDISVSHVNGSFSYAQLKLHKKTAGDLSDSGVDLWRTLRVWLDAISEDHSLLTNTAFFLITTAAPAENSIAKELQSETPSYERIYSTLENIANTSKNQTTAKARESFLNYDKSSILALLKRISIITSAPDILEVISRIKSSIRLSCPIGSEDEVFERLTGWWNDVIIEGLSNENPTFISKLELRRKLSNIARQYYDDNLPINIPSNFPLPTLPPSAPPVFVKQIRLIQHTENTVQNARRDYYRAYEQRSRWVRDSLIALDDLDTYDDHLSDEWARHFDEMEIDVSSLPNPKETDLQRYGSQLYRTVMHSRQHIREKCTEPFIMRGSYHLLADQQKVGWHRYYKERLQDDNPSDTEVYE